jgi:trehalose 6-phosphate phosphatase
MHDIRSTIVTRPEWLRTNADDWAIFIDIDGTLLEMAPRPDAVIVPIGLAAMLGALADRLGGALALSTGRSVAEADRLLTPLKLVTSGVHGTEVRSSPNDTATMLVPPVSAALLKEVMDVAQMSPEIIVETKGAGVAVHYRQVPELRSVLENGDARGPRLDLDPPALDGPRTPQLSNRRQVDVRDTSRARVI